jgi:hypothetical protein
MRSRKIPFVKKFKISFVIRQSKSIILWCSLKVLRDFRSIPTIPVSMRDELFVGNRQIGCSESSHQTVLNPDYRVMLRSPEADICQVFLNPSGLWIQIPKAIYLPQKGTRNSARTMKCTIIISPQFFGLHLSPLTNTGVASSYGQLTVWSRGHARIFHLTSYSNRILVLHRWLPDISAIFVFKSYLRPLPRHKWLDSAIIEIQTCWCKCEQDFYAGAC